MQSLEAKTAWKLPFLQLPGCTVINCGEAQKSKQHRAENVDPHASMIIPATQRFHKSSFRMFQDVSGAQSRGTESASSARDRPTWVTSRPTALSR